MKTWILKAASFTEFPVGFFLILLPVTRAIQLFWFPDYPWTSILGSAIFLGAALLLVIRLAFVRVVSRKPVKWLVTIEDMLQSSLPGYRLMGISVVANAYANFGESANDRLSPELVQRAIMSNLLLDGFRSNVNQDGLLYAGKTAGLGDVKSSLLEMAMRPTHWESKYATGPGFKVSSLQLSFGAFFCCFVSAVYLWIAWDGTAEYSNSLQEAQNRLLTILVLGLVSWVAVVAYGVALNPRKAWAKYDSKALKFPRNSPIRTGFKSTPVDDLVQMPIDAWIYYLENGETRPGALFAILRSGDAQLAELALPYIQRQIRTDVSLSTIGEQFEKHRIQPLG